MKTNTNNLKIFSTILLIIRKQENKSKQKKIKPKDS